MSQAPADGAMNTPDVPAPATSTGLAGLPHEFEEIQHAEDFVDGGEGTCAPVGKGNLLFIRQGCSEGTGARF